jgi:hypothetical protein
LNAIRLIFRTHAIQRMFERGISRGEVRQRYPDDVPYASRLVLGWAGGRPIHVVAADNLEAHETIVITVYEPDLGRWEPGFRQRRRA